MDSFDQRFVKETKRRSHICNNQILLLQRFRLKILKLKATFAVKYDKRLPELIIAKIYQTTRGYKNVQ